MLELLIFLSWYGSFQFETWAWIFAAVLWCFRLQAFFKKLPHPIFDPLEALVLIAALPGTSPINGWQWALWISVTFAVFLIQAASINAKKKIEGENDG